VHVVGHVVENAQAVLLAANLQRDVARRGAKALAGLQRASAAAAEAEAVAILEASFPAAAPAPAESAAAGAAIAEEGV